MAKPAQIDLGSWPQGDTWPGQSFQLKEKESQNPIDLTDCEVYSKWRTDVGNVVSKDLSLGDGLTIVDPLEGILRFDVQELDIKKEIHNMDIRIIFPDGRAKTWIACTINIILGETYG